jgi:hypothetical protein
MFVLNLLLSSSWHIYAAPAACVISSVVLILQISSPSVPAVMDSSYSERIVEKATSCLPRLALEAPNSPVVPRPEETSLLQVAEQPKALKEQEKENEEGASQTCQASSSSTKAAAAAAASTNTRRKASSSRLGALWMPVIGTLLRASAIN